MMGMTLAAMTGALSALAAAAPTRDSDVPAPFFGPASMEAAPASSVAAEQPRTRRRRRRRPRPRGGPYSVTEVKQGGTIEGVALFRGDVPGPRRIRIVKDHQTCSKRNKIARKIKVNDKSQVAEVVVFLGDIKAGKPIEPLADKPVIDQRTCTFSPHVQVVARYQPLEIVNNDPVAHNAHVTQRMSTVINPMQPRRGMRAECSFSEVGPATIKCDIHNWMRAYVYVLWHPYYDVTGRDGGFRLTDVPPGEYELVAWQEHLGERTTRVTVAAGKTTKVEFELTE
ncbi:MAG: carboxypeptidase regulatory-like domain-containing protein [Phycisphaerae bacterium]